MKASRIACCLGAVLALSVSRTAVADEPTPEARREELAKAAVRRGLTALARGDAQTALDEYLQAEAFVPTANVPYRYAAEALAQLGRVDEAIQSLEKYLTLKQDVSDADAVRARIASLRALRMGKLVIDCSASLVSISLDGAPAESRACPAELVVSAGEHALSVTAEGRQPSRSKVVAVSGLATHVAVPLAPLPPPPPAPGSSAQRTLGFVALGLGGAMLVTGVVLDVAVLGPSIDDLRAATARGDRAADDAQASARTQRTLSLTMYAVGAAVAMTGAIAILTSRRTTIRSAVGPRDVSLMGSVSF